jgi:hypothetical protein
MAYTGDVPANTDMQAYGSIIKNTANGNFSSQQIGVRQYCVTIQSPTNGTSVVFAYLYDATTFTVLEAICAGGTSAAITIYDQTTAYSGGSSVATYTATTSGGGTSFSTGVTGGHYINATIGTVSGTITTLTIILTGYVT